MARIALLIGVFMMAFAAMAGDATGVVDKSVAKDDGARVWIVPEYYGMMTKDSPYPDFPLVTSGYLTIFGSGILGNPGTTVLFDQDKEDFGIQHGFKMTIGGWITEDRKWGAEVDGFYQPEVDESTTLALDPSDPFNILCIPYFDQQLGTEQCAGYVALGFDSASVKISNRQEFWGVGGHGIRNIRRSENFDMDALFGVRYLKLSDEFSFEQASHTNFVIPFAEFIPTSGSYSLVDSFQGENDFFGADLGLRLAYHKGRFRAELQPRVAIGATFQEMNIHGTSSVADTLSGTTIVRPGGFWALDTNSGNHDQTKFTVVPEVHLKLGVEICKNVEFLAGYSAIYWSSVVRGGDHVKREINIDKIAMGGYGPFATTLPANPSFEFNTTNFWAHGVTAGIKIKF